MLVKFLKFRDKKEVHDNDIDNDFLCVTLNIIDQVNVLNVLRKKDFENLIL